MVFMDTFFAPAERTERRNFKNQLMDVNQSPVMNALLEASEGILVVLNEDRQIIAMNHFFLEELGLPDIQEVLGMRLGESLTCIHAFDKGLLGAEPQSIARLAGLPLP